MKSDMRREISLQEGDALLIVDVQNDFMPGGALGVNEGDKIIEPINRALALFQTKVLPVFFSRDWHPSDHSSFRTQGGPWPPHCVRETTGASFTARIRVPDRAVTFSKGMDREKEQYSAFAAQADDGRSLREALFDLGIRRIFVGGLATDYCVLNTVLDLVIAGYTVVVLVDACRAVDVHPGDGEKALEQMRVQGAATALTGELR